MLQLEGARERIDELHEKNDHLRLKLSRTLGRRLLKAVRRMRARLGRSGDRPLETDEPMPPEPEPPEAEPESLRE
jgi:hypothetical protein